MPVQTQFSTDPNAIVTVHVSIIEAPTPINYQRTGAFVSFGATTLPVGSTELLTQLSDLAVPPIENPSGPPIMRTPGVVSSITWAGGVATVHTAAPIPNVSVGNIVPMVLSGFTPIGPGLNGLKNCTITSTTAFTYAVTPDPTPVSVQGTYQFHSSIELNQMATTFFGQGNEVGVWVLELGYDNNPSNNVSALANWLQNNPLTVYGFLLPRRFGCDPAILGSAAVPFPFTNLLKQYEAPSNTMEYFWLTVASGDINGSEIGRASCRERV